MALLDSEGFGFSAAIADYNTYNTWPFQTSTAPTIGTGGVFGDNFLNCGNANGNGPTRALPGTFTTWFCGFRFNFNAGTTTQTVIQFLDPGLTPQASVTFGPGALQVNAYRGNQSVLLGTVSGVLQASPAWQYVEIGGVIDAVTGSIVVKVNGTTVLNLTGVNTKGSAGSSTIQFVRFTSASGSFTGGAFQHWYFCDNSGSAPWNTFLGDVRVQTIVPTSNDAVNFTPNGLAANWQNAAKIPPVPATDFNSSANVGDQDTFNCGTIAAGLTTVFGVNVKVLALKSDAGSRFAQTVMKSGLTTSLGASTGLSTTAIQLRTMLQTDPNTSAQWLAAAVNAANPGYKLSA